MKVQQSTFISRFGGGKSPVSKTTAHIPVHPVPATTYAEPKAPKPIHEPKQAHHTAAAHTKSVTSPIHHALQHATSHEQTYKAKKVRKHHKIANRLGIHRRVVSGAAMAFAVLTLGGFIAYQNMANITMRVASARAGINANMPDYQPSGFALSGPVNYSPGKVVLSFKSNTDQRSFELKQQASNWNSETLLQNIVANNTKSYQTYEDKGKTIYIYDGSNATWVDGGILYKIEGSSSLSNDQLIRMAASL
jgi:hypothetical protein